MRLREAIALMGLEYVRTATQHDEPPVVSHVVVWDRGALPEIVLVGEQARRFAEGGLGPPSVEGGLKN